MSIRNETFRNAILFVGILLVVSGIGVLLYHWFMEKRYYVYDQMNAVLYETAESETAGMEEEIEDPVLVETPDDQDDIVSTPSNSLDSAYYIGFLEIPKLGIKKGFLRKEDPDNTIEKNIMVLPSSMYPNEERSNLILAGHSGYGYKAFFQALYKLTKGDMAVVSYQGVRYTYQIVSIYTQPRTGKLFLYRDYQKRCLTLITCTKDDKNTQTVYIAELVLEEKEE